MARKLVKWYSTLVNFNKTIYFFLLFHVLHDTIFSHNKLIIFDAFPSDCDEIGISVGTWNSPKVVSQNSMIVSLKVIERT